MNYEKKYKEALERARVYHTGGSISDAHITEVIFPELKESEDERHRKWILEYLYYGLRKADEQFKPQFEVAIAWLEKQGKQQGISAFEAWKDMRLEVYQQASGNRHEPNYSDDSTKMFSLNDIDEIIEKISEQKLDDKVEPKFKVGDWVVNNVCLPMQIASIKDGMYVFTKGDAISVSFVDENYHLWTIQDAMDGDVLVHNECPFIFMGIKDGIVQALEKNLLEGTNPVNFGEPKIDNDYQPATKEQRDLLFSKIKEAGYKWDSEKKELKKIEVTSKESEDEKTRKELIAFLKENLSLGYPDETWDSKGLKRWIAWLEKQGKEEYTLKSFKDEDIRKFMQYIEKQAKAYEFNLPNRGYDIYAFTKDILYWLEKQGEQTHAKLGQSEVTKKSDQELSDIIEPKLKVGNDEEIDRKFLASAYDNITQPHWISVEDEEPPKGQWIITYEPTSPIVIGTDFILPDETAHEHHITHWMPLPQPPTVAKNATVKKGGEE